MKKAIISAAVFCAALTAASSALAADSIDPAGKAGVAINRPTAQLTMKAELRSESLDSNGYLTVALFGGNVTAGTAGKAETMLGCLDSGCRVRL